MRSAPVKKTIFLLHHTARVSGAEISMKMLARHLNPNLYRVVVLYGSGQGQLGALLKQSGLHCKALPFMRLKRTLNPFAWLAYLASILYCGSCIFILAHRYRAALLHANTTHARLYAYLPCLLSGIPCVWHIRDEVPGIIPVRALETRSAGIIAISKFVTPAVLAASSRLHIIPNATGIQLAAKHTGYIRKTFHLPEDALLVAQAGQLIPWKNHRHFILAAEKVVQQFSNVRFIIIGSDLFQAYPSYQQELEQLISEKHLESYFLFTGHITDIAAALQDIDILFHPAANEPFGRVLIEAMSLGKPVVSVNKGGPAEIVTHQVTGYLAEPGHTGAMAAYLLALLQNAPLRNLVGSKAQRYAQEHFGIPQHVRAIETVYEKILAQ